MTAFLRPEDNPCHLFIIPAKCPSSLCLPSFLAPALLSLHVYGRYSEESLLEGSTPPRSSDTALRSIYGLLFSKKSHVYPLELSISLSLSLSIHSLFSFATYFLLPCQVKSVELSKGNPDLENRVFQCVHRQRTVFKHHVAFARGFCVTCKLQVALCGLWPFSG